MTTERNFAKHKQTSQGLECTMAGLGPCGLSCRAELLGIVGLTLAPYPVHGALDNKAVQRQGQQFIDSATDHPDPAQLCSFASHNMKDFRSMV